MENLVENESDSEEITLEWLDELDDLLNQMIWMPSIISKDVFQDCLIKQCRGIFNKITTVDETFPKLMRQFEELINEERDERMREVAAMYLEQVTGDTLMFFNAYVQFAVTVSKRRQLFKKAIISECQKQFEGNVLNFDLNEELQQLLQKIHATENPYERAEQQIIYDERKRQLTQKSTKIVRFIGELCNNGVLTSSIIMCCISVLSLDQTSEPKLEFLCNLLTTTGARLENGIKHRSHHNVDIDNCFETMMAIAESKYENVKICHRLRCLILNVVDLRKNNWIHRQETVVHPVESNSNQRKRAGYFISNQNRVNGSEKNGHKKPAKSDKDQKSDSTMNSELIPKRIKDLLKHEIDVATIQTFIIANLAGVDADYIRAIMRTVVECLMEEETLKLRGNNEATSILRTFFELLEK